jgi:hypothetical protein
MFFRKSLANNKPVFKYKALFAPDTFYETHFLVQIFSLESIDLHNGIAGTSYLYKFNYIIFLDFEIQILQFLYCSSGIINVLRGDTGKNTQPVYNSSNY